MSDNRSLRQKIDDGDYRPSVPYARPTEDWAAWQIYQAEIRRLDAEFRRDLAEHLGILPGPKCDLLLAKALELGHSSGYAEVVGYAEDLMELIE